MVGVKAGRVVATHGDMKAEVNRGLNMVSGSAACAALCSSGCSGLRP
jgi:hypothetical protein